MRTSRLVTIGDLTWPRPLASVRSGHIECQVSRSSYPGIDFLGVINCILLFNSEYNHRRINVIFLQDKHNINAVYLNLIHIHLLF